MLAYLPLMTGNYHPPSNHQILPSPHVYVMKVTAEHYHKVSHIHGYTHSYLQGNLDKLWHTYFQLVSKQKEHQLSSQFLPHFAISLSMLEFLGTSASVTNHHCA